MVNLRSVEKAIPIIEWSEWADGRQYATVGPYAVGIEMVVPDEPTNYGTRKWEVRRGEIVVASGYVLGSNLAERMIRWVLAGWNVPTTV